MRNTKQYPIQFSDLIDTIETSKLSLQDIVGSVYPVCLQYINEFLVINKDNLDTFLKSKQKE